MNAMAFVDILSRWLHVISACLLVGGAFFMRVVLPAGTTPLDAEGREGTLLRCRRAFKMIVHPAILVFLVTGIYNAIKNWPQYKLKPGLTHGLFGLHVLLAVAVMAILLWLLAGREARRNTAWWLQMTVALAFLAVLAASGLKWARDRAMAEARDRPIQVNNQIIYQLGPTTAPAGAAPATAPATSP
jgi:uncharacterized membrane protein